MDLIRKEFCSKDFNAVVKTFDQHRAQGASISSTLDDDDEWYYTIVWYEKEHDITKKLELLAEMSKNASKLEVRSALDFAIGAIKTLIDMGVLTDDSE